METKIYTLLSNFLSHSKMEKMFFDFLLSQKEFLIRLLKKHLWFYESEKTDKSIDQLSKIISLFKEVKTSENAELMTKDESSFFKKKLMESIEQQ